MAITQDEPFREIQLDGKHLVFLFMAVTVLAVVVFLSGVMVGRGVRAARGLPADGSEAAAVAAATSGAEVPAAVAPPPPSSAATATPVTASETLSYAERLSGSSPAAEQLQKAEPPPPAEEDPKTAAPVAAAPAPMPVAKATMPAAVAATSSGEPGGNGFAIQVAALRERAEADTIVKRLAAKGYPAYVLAPSKGAPSVFRVRVGKFTDRKEADAMALRLQKEEQFKPWVVR